MTGRPAGPDDSAQPPRAGRMLRQWRAWRGKSQLELALDAGVSQRHVSFIESGRSQASRQMLLDLAQALDVPLGERNSLLLAGGFAPVYPEAGLDAPAMRQLTRGLKRMLHQHEPFPAVVMDRHWDLLMTNAAAPRFFSCFIDMHARTARRNLLHLMFDPAGMRPFLRDWPAVAQALLARVYREAGHVVDGKGRALLAELARYPDVTLERGAVGVVPELPMIPLSFEKDGTVLRYFSLVTTVGTAQSVAADDLRLECMFPADDATEAGHAAFVAANARLAETAAAAGREAVAPA